jgi:microcystin-dependent protein
MSSPYIGEIRMFAGNFAPVGWAFCNGALIPIDQNDALFNLIGTTYGGDGQTTFALPNLQSRVPVHVGPGFALGQSGGAESVTLTTQQIPAHNHTFLPNSGGATANAQATPPGNSLADENLPAPPSPRPFTYAPFVSNDPNQRSLGPSAIGPAGGSQPHDNMIPFLVINFIISLFGVFPSQS